MKCSAPTKNNFSCVEGMPPGLWLKVRFGKVIALQQHWPQERIHNPNNGFTICDIRKWWELGGRAQLEGIASWRHEPEAYILYLVFQSLAPPFLCHFFSVIMFLPCKRLKCNTLGLEYLVAELTFFDETRIGLFISDMESKDKPLKSSLVPLWAVDFLTGLCREVHLQYHRQLQNSHIICKVAQCPNDDGLMKLHHGVFS